MLFLYSVHHVFANVACCDKYMYMYAHICVHSRADLVRGPLWVGTPLNIIIT